MFLIYYYKFQYQNNDYVFFVRKQYLMNQLILLQSLDLKGKKFHFENRQQQLLQDFVQQHPS